MIPKEDMRALPHSVWPRSKSRVKYMERASTGHLWGEIRSWIPPLHRRLLILSFDKASDHDQLMSGMRKYALLTRWSNPVGGRPKAVPGSWGYTLDSTYSVYIESHGVLQKTLNMLM